MRQTTLRVAHVAVLAVIAMMLAAVQSGASTPTSTVKVAFIHHSVGQNWLDDSQGGLAAGLQAHNYYVSDTNYGWGPDAIGDHTDIPDWLSWFTGPSSPTYLAALADLDDVNSPYARTLADPGGDTDIIVFKSCYPNSSLSGAPSDPPDPEPGLTVGHAKYVYDHLLPAFAAQPDTLFVVVTAPPNSDLPMAANARAFNTWLVESWLDGYAGRNVAVFDFYNVLTGPENHHRLVGGVVEHVHTPGMDSAYYTVGGDDHPTVEGSRKATEEFVPLLDHFYAQWKAEPDPTPSPSPSAYVPTTPAPPVTTGPAATSATPTTPAPIRGVVPVRVQGLVARGKGRRVIVRWSGPAAVGYIVQGRWRGATWRTVAQVGPSVRRVVWRSPAKAGLRVRVAATDAAGRGPFAKAKVL